MHFQKKGTMYRGNRVIQDWKFPVQPHDVVMNPNHEYSYARVNDTSSPSPQTEVNGTSQTEGGDHQTGINEYA